ncbi:IS5 family transposase [Galbitalea sp. SE-J8]|uniref:IS5 family transposase n=1 Tax=Galbitalea sp. SE-J8 TaxID=3054952 RepID=UPI00259CB6AA|nr:IS5 family transposase [Galbitalea sp. SE-J8]MDM4761668.1 IS5 family transposase [Galbitalea sp. SE-J8]
MPAVPSSIIEPLWHQFEALVPPVVDEHPLGCHRPRVSDRVVFDKLIQVLVLGAGYVKIADDTCSATTIRRRRDEWIRHGIFTMLEQICLDAYDKMIGLQLGDLSVDGCIVKGPCGGEAAGRSPVDRGRQGTKRSLLVDGNGIPLGCVIAGANCHDSPLLAPTLEELGRFGFDLPERITVHLDAGYDSGKTRDLLDTLGVDYVISKKGTPLQTGARWVVERTNSWHTRGFRKLQICTERRTRVIDAFIALAGAIIITRRLIREAWTRHRWDTRPTRRP